MTPRRMLTSLRRADSASRPVPQWLGQWHIMWQANGGWAHAVSSDLAHWTSLSVKTSLAVAGPNAWDGSLTILDGKPVALCVLRPARPASSAHVRCSRGQRRCA